MRRYPILGMMLLIPAIALLLVVGCTKPPSTDKKPGADSADKKDKDTTKVVDITTATKATVKGTVKLKGDVPEVKSIADLKAFQAHSDKAYCSMGDLKEQQWMVDNDKHVENVIVFLAPPEGKAFKIADDLKAKYKKTVTIDQPYCQYVPHVEGIYVGVQEFQVLNSAKIKHSVKITASPRNGSSTESIEAGKPTTKKEYKEVQAEPIKIECADHSWMNAFLVTFNHPYFARTKADGSFEIANVPIDEELVIYTWHEVPGKKEAGKQKFKEGDNKVELSVSK